MLKQVPAVGFELGYIVGLSPVVRYKTIHPFLTLKQVYIFILIRMEQGFNNSLLPISTPIKNN